MVISPRLTFYLLILISFSQAAVFDLEALMAMIENDEHQRVAPPAQAFFGAAGIHQEAVHDQPTEKTANNS